MSLSSPVGPRARIHVRQISASGWRREDGLWDIEARLTDTKDKDCPIPSGLRPAGEPIHDMWVRVTIDREFNVLGAEATIDAAPYLGGCDAIAPDYSQIVGLNLVRGFRRTVAEMFETVRGCAHLSELLGVLPTAAIQTFAGEVLDTDGLASDQQPFQLDRCHALETTSETVRRYYPRWYRGGKTGQKSA